MDELFRILIIDNEKSVLDSLSRWLREDGHDVQTATTGREAIALAQKSSFNLALVDLILPGMDGITTLLQLRQIAPDCEAVTITAKGTVQNAVEAMKAGAYDYLVKPVNIEQLREIIKRLVERESLIAQNVAMKRRLDESDRFVNIIGASAAMQEIFQLIRDTANTNSTVLIRGESGTGKELIARAIHHLSDRRYLPFVAVSCGALPETLLESELFGHARGSFTGAVSDHAGHLEAAGSGTIFLDEIGEISAKTQVDLLRVLESRTFSRVGDTKLRKVKARFLAATNSDLAGAINNGTFRDDLYYRLNVIPIRVPPLRERDDDIELLAEHFRRHFNKVMNKHISGFTRSAIEIMKDYPWPGNVRELENAIERAFVVGKKDLIDADALHIIQPENVEANAPASLEKAIQQHIEQVLEQNEWNVAKTARALGISRVTLYQKIRKYGLKKQGSL